MQEKRSRKTIETHDDLRRLYTDAVRDNAVKNGFTFEEADQKSNRAWANTSRPLFAEVALTLNEIYEAFGYEIASGAAGVAARFENSLDFDMQTKIVDVLAYVGEKNKHLLRSLIPAIERLFESIEKRRDVKEEVIGFYLLEGEGAIGMIFFSQDEPSFKYLLVGDPAEFRELVEKEMVDNQDEVVTDALKQILKKLDERNSQEIMKRASDGIHEELSGDITDIIKKLKGQERE